MKYLIIILSLLLMGCASGKAQIKNYLDSIPTIAFDNLDYKRFGSFSTATITVKGAKVEDGFYKINYITVIENWPFGSIDFEIENYSRKLKDEL